MMVWVQRTDAGKITALFGAMQAGYAEEELPDDNAEVLEYLNFQTSAAYRIGKSTPWRRMTDAEAVKVEATMATVPVRLRMIYDASSYLDSADELFGQLETVIVGAGLSASRAKALLAPEE